MHMAECLIQMDNIPIYPIISFGLKLYYIYNPRSSPGLALQAYRNFEKYLMVFFPIFNMIGTCKFDMWTTKRLCIHQYWTKIRQCPVFFNFSLQKEVGTFTKKLSIHNGKPNMWKIYLGGLRFNSHLCLLYFRICARTVYKIRGSRHTSPVLRTGRSVVSKMHAIVYYCQSIIIMYSRKKHGAIQCF